MEKTTFIALLIEAVVTLTPVITLFFRMGSWKKGVDKDIQGIMTDVTRQRSDIDLLQGSLNKMNDTLTSISTKMDLLLQGKIRTDV